MKRLLQLSALLMITATAGAQVVTYPKQEKMNFNGTRQVTAGQSHASAIVGVTDTLHYFYNKNFWLNPTGQWNQFYYWEMPSPTSSLNAVTHLGSVFQNSVSITVHGLEGMVMRNPASTSSAVPVKFYLHNVNALNQPLPPIDSVLATVTGTNGGYFVGGLLNAPRTMTANFAVTFKSQPVLSGDTAYLFMNAGYNPTATATGSNVVKYGEGLGRLRYLGNWQSTNNVFGPGTSFEYIVAPWVSFNYQAGISVTTPSICNNSNGTFSNTSSPQSIIENRQFNFNRFASYWKSMYTNTVVLNTDSIYSWTFTGATPPASFAKNPSPLFTTQGTQTASLAVKYWHSATGGFFGPATPDGTTANITVDAVSSPSIGLTGNTSICAGQSTTLTANSTGTVSWLNPSSSSASVVVSPSSQSIYTAQSIFGNCTAIKSVTVMVAPAPTVQVSGPGSVCSGQTFTLGASGAQSYLWSNTLTQSVITQVISTPGVEQYTVTGSAGVCPSSSAAISVTVNALPSVTVTTPTNSVCTKATGGTSVALNGFPGGGTYSGVNVVGPSFTPQNITGVFTIQYSYTDPTTNCSANAVTTLTIVTCLGVGIQEHAAVQLSAYPNPAIAGVVNISNISNATTLTVYNILGELVRTEKVSGSQHRLDLSGLPQGQYFVRLAGAAGDAGTVKIVNQH